MSQGSNFVDYVKICCRSGKGGAGSAHLHRDILTSMGGPDGGDGGRGGHIIVKGSIHIWTLFTLNTASILLLKMVWQVGVLTNLVARVKMRF